jgi:hypothetical protein
METHNCAISNDGTKIAFRSNRDGDDLWVASVDGGQARVGDLRPGRSTEFAQLRERDRIVGVTLDEDRLADRPPALEVLRLLADDDVGLGVLDDVATLLARVREVDGDDDRARGERAEVGERPFRARAGEERDAIAGRDARPRRARRRSQ